MSFKLDVKLTPKQSECWNRLEDKTTRYPVFGGGAGGGKSWLICEWLIINCIRYPNTKWFIARNELTRLMQSTYVTFQKVIAYHKIPTNAFSLNGQYHYIEFGNKSRIDLLDLKFLPSDPFYERFGSLEYTGGAIEEAGEVDFGAFDMLKSRIGRYQNKELDIPPKILITCNPKKNWLYRMIYLHYKQKTLGNEYAFIQSLYGDNPHTIDSYKMQLSDISDKSLRQRLMFGNWEYDEDINSLINYDSILDIFKNKTETKGKYLTCDIARFGSDKSVIYLWNGYDIAQIHIYQKQGLDKTTEGIRNLMYQNDIPRNRVVIDEDGIGGGIVDNLQGTKGFIANSSPFNDPRTNEKTNYKNLKAQCGFMLADKINKREIGISAKLDENTKHLIITDLEQLKAKDVERDAPRQLVPKEEIKENLGRSPDFLDAMIMRMYFELDRPYAQVVSTFKPDWNTTRQPIKTFRPKW